MIAGSMLVMAYFRGSLKGVEVTMSLQSQGSRGIKQQPQAPLQLVMRPALASATSLFAPSLVIF